MNERKFTMMMWFRKIHGEAGERGSLPAVLGAIILISATSVLLAAYAIASTRNMEMVTGQQSINSALSDCEHLLTVTVQQNPISDTPPDLAGVASSQCQFPNVKTNVTASQVENYTPSGGSNPTHVKVTLTATTTTTPSVSNSVVKYLEYSEGAAGTATVTPQTYVTGFDPVTGEATSFGTFGG